MAQDLKPGQFWRDTVNGDLLKILEIDSFDASDVCTLAGCEGDLPPRPIPYVRSACYPRGEYFMGIQEMKASHFEEARFQPIKLGWFKNFWWTRVKFRP